MFLFCSAEDKNMYRTYLRQNTHYRTLMKQSIQFETPVWLTITELFFLGVIVILLTISMRKPDLDYIQLISEDTAMKKA